MTFEDLARKLGALAVALSLAPPSVAIARPADPVVEAQGASVLVPTERAASPVVAAPQVDLATLDPVARLAPAEQVERNALDQIRAWNRAGGRPRKNGFLRTLPRSPAVLLTARDLTSYGTSPLAGGLLSVDADRAVWVTSVEVDAAHALRVRLRIDSLPEGTRLWTRGDDGRPLGPFGPEVMAASGETWLPPVSGPLASVEISVPRSSLETGPPLRARVDAVMELLDPAGAGDVSPASATPCEIDGRCVGPATLSVIDDYRHAVARLQFVENGFGFLCSGSLVNDTDDGTAIPYLLTANHCLSDQAAASSLVAYFDDFPSICDGTPPSLASLPQVTGSTLLATGSTSDFTLLQLSGLPAGYNYFLGWTTRPLVEGETLYMLSHPEGRRQGFSTSTFTQSPSQYCGFFSGLFYADQSAGSTLGGSSGAPAIVDEAGGQIVGQLLGACLGPAVDDCDYSSYSEVDGAFSVTFPLVADYLDPPVPTLTVSAVDAQAGEPGETGAFRISRNLDTAAAAQVTVSVGGSASAGSDYMAIASPVTIPAGQASVDVAVTPIDDTIEEPIEEVSLTLVSSPGFVIGDPAAAAVSLADDDGDDCRSVVVADTTLAAMDAVACGRLHAGPSLTIAAGGPVGLFGGTSVALYDGFTTAAGASLSIGTCGQNLCVSASTTPTSASCHPCVAQVCAADSFCCTSAWDPICVGEVGSICELTCP